MTVADLLVTRKYGISIDEGSRTHSDIERGAGIACIQDVIRRRRSATKPIDGPNAIGRNASTQPPVDFDSRERIGGDERIVNPRRARRQGADCYCAHSMRFRRRNTHPTR